MNTNINEAVAVENAQPAGAAKPANQKKVADVAAEITTNSDGKPFGVKFTFGGDATRTVELNIHKLNDDIMLMAALHGLKQKLGDAAAISRNGETGRSATPEDKYRAVREIADRLLEGEWNKRREGGGNAGGLLMRALLRLYAGRMTKEQVEAWLGEKTDKEKAALRKNPKIITIIEEIRAEDGASGSGDDLLAELESMGQPDGAPE